MSTASPVRVKCLNPVFSTSIRYSPGNKFTNVKSPSVPLGCVRFSAVPTLVSVTAASATVAPVVSATVPEMDPNVDCACSDTHDRENRTPTHNSDAESFRDDMVYPAGENLFQNK